LQAVLLAPGTGVTGGINYASNIGKLLTRDGYNPVYLNVPDHLLSDIPDNAQYVAYAMNYLYRYTGNQKVTLVTWSQGSLDAQWSFKYFKSTRDHVSDHVAVSPDYHGTILALLLCPGFEVGNAVACTPSVYQQVYSSNFINTLRANGGDTAYVDTTTVYSLTDEIVQPQEGTAASGYILGKNGIQTSNTFLQGACALQPAGLVYTHEGVLYNPVTYALLIDAMTHDGPGDFSRVSSACQDIAAPGLSVSDILETESTIVLAALNILSYTPKTTVEPSLPAYSSQYS
jgi:hypothetical protein